MAKKSTRNSSIELLKVIAIIFIVISHAIPYSDEFARSYINQNICTTDPQIFLMVIFKYLAQVGNVIFIVCSAFFLFDSKKTRFDKVIEIVLDAFIISVVILVTFLTLGYDLSLSEIAKQLIPVTMNNNWFVCCYIIFYLIHPGLNYIVSSISQKSLLTLNLITIFFYCIVNLIVPDRYYYSPLVGFIVIYFIVAYMKKYMIDFMSNKKANLILFVVSFALLILQIIGTNILGLTTGIFAEKLAFGSIIINPFIIFAVLGLFNLVKMHSFNSGVINYISSVSLLIYIIHGNNLVMTYAKTDVFNYIYDTFGYEYVLLWVLLVALVLFVGGFVFSAIYTQSIKKFVQFISGRIVSLIARIFNPLVSYFLNQS